MLCPFYMTLVMLSISEIGLQRNIDKVYEFCKKKKKKKKKKTGDLVVDLNLDLI